MGLVVQETNDPAIYRWMLRQSAEVWKDDLSTEQYVSRDDVLTPSKLYNFQNRSADDPVGIHYYILRDTSLVPKESEPQANFNIVCSCELIVRRSWRLQNGVWKDVLSGCVGSVYTLPLHRGKGFAGHLLSQLDSISEQLMGPDSFLSLYSEVGTYYERFQYHSYPVAVVELPPMEVVEDKVDVSSAKPLKFNQFELLIDQYKARFASYIQLKDGQTQRVAILPSLEMIEWHHIRSRYISSTLHGKLPDNFGFQVGQHSFVIFSHDYGDHSVTVHMLYASGLEELKLLLCLVCKEAHDLGYKNVHMWESQLWDYSLRELDELERLLVSEMVTDELRGQMGLENGSLSALKMLDGSYSEWEGNHKWPWF